MSLEVPESFKNHMKQAQQNTQKLAATIRANPRAFSQEQTDQLHLHFNVIRNIHDALQALVDANS
jgi:hypothetical protein